MRRTAIPCRFLYVFLLACSGFAAQSEPETNLSYGEIMDGLKQKQGEELTAFIISLNYNVDKSRLSDHEIDQIVERLLEIQQSDPYQKNVVFKTAPGTFYPNRHNATPCIFRFRCQKIANSFRDLPIEQRGDKIIDGIERPPELGYDTTGFFSAELVRAGKDAVPYIVQHKPAASYHRRAIVAALAAIGDPRGVDYIIEVLKTEDETFKFERPIAARDLAKFRGETVIAALVDALQDNTFEDIDKRLPQQTRPDHKPYIGRHYSVQHAAAESLSVITGKKWGSLYNEDYKTWLSWRQSGASDTFSPATVKRSDKEVAELIERMFHRYMSGRPNPWQQENVLATEQGIQNLANDLKPLGKRIVPMIVEQYQARVGATPLWGKELRGWTQKILISLDWPEGKKAAAALD